MRIGTCCLYVLVLGLVLSTSSVASSEDNVISISSGYLEDGMVTYPQSRSIEYPVSGVEVGEGWNSLKQETVRAQCVEFSKSEAGGQSATLSMKRVEDRDSLRREMDMGFATTAKAKFKLGSAEMSAKTRFFQSSKVENHSVNLLVAARVVNGVAFTAPSGDLPQVQLNTFGKKMWNKSAAEFQKHCGDSFISSITRGSELFALYGLTETAVANLKKFDGTFTGKGSYMGFSGSLSYDLKKLKEVTKDRSVASLKYYHSAHRGLTIPSGEEGIKTSIEYLGSALELKDSYPFRINLMRYDALPSFSPRKLQYGLTLDERREAYRLRLEGLVSFLDHVIKYKDAYRLNLRGKDIGYYRDLQDHIARLLDQVSEEIKVCNAQLNLTDKAFSNSVVDCLASQDNKYSDYFLRAQMPVHNDFLRELTREEAKTKADLETRRNSLISRKNAHLVKIYKKAKKCKWGIGKGGICGYDRIPEGCNLHPRDGVCRQYDADIRDAVAKIDKFDSDKQYILDADSRFMYWIDEASRRRRDNQEINGYLSNRELDLIKTEIYSQYEQFKDGLGKDAVGFSKRVIEGDRLRFVYRFNEKYKADRDQKAVNTLLKQKVGIMEKLATIWQKYWNLNGPKFDRKTIPPYIPLPKIGEMLQPLILQNTIPPGEAEAIGDELEKFLTTEQNLGGSVKSPRDFFNADPKVKALKKEIKSYDFSVQNLQGATNMARDILAQAGEALIKENIRSGIADFSPEKLEILFNERYVESTSKIIGDETVDAWERTQPEFSLDLDFDVVVQSY